MMLIENEPGIGWCFNLRGSLGMTTTLLLVARVGWRLLNRPEPLCAAKPSPSLSPGHTPANEINNLAQC